MEPKKEEMIAPLRQKDVQKHLDYLNKYCHPDLSADRQKIIEKVKVWFAQQGLTLTVGHKDNCACWKVE